MDCHAIRTIARQELTIHVRSRWTLFCPYGIDTAEVSMAARDIMDSVGLGQKYSNEIIGKVHRIGNNLGLPAPALRDTLDGLEEDVKEATGVDVRFPLDEKGAQVLEQGIREVDAFSTLVKCIDCKKLLGVFDGQHLDNDRIDEAEDCGVEANAKAERDDCHEREAGRLLQHPGGIS